MIPVANLKSGIHKRMPYIQCSWSPWSWTLCLLSRLVKTCLLIANPLPLPACLPAHARCAGAAHRVPLAGAVPPQHGAGQQEQVPGAGHQADSAHPHGGGPHRAQVRGAGTGAGMEILFEPFPGRLECCLDSPQADRQNLGSFPRSDKSHSTPPFVARLPLPRVRPQADHQGRPSPSLQLQGPRAAGAGWAGACGGRLLDR